MERRGKFMAMLHPTPQSLRPTGYQPPTTANVVTVRPSQTRPARPKRQRVSEAEYWEKYYIDLNDHQYEWNNGYLEEKPMPDKVSFLMYKWFFKLLDSFLEVCPQGEIIGLEMAFRLVLPHKIIIRKPDLGLVLNSNPVPLGPKHQSYRGIFDMCLESLSYSKPGEIKRDTVTKKREYAQAGVKEYYILDLRGTKTAFYQLTPGGIYRPIPPTPDGLMASNVLPGFHFRLTDLQRQPSLEQMSEDPVYSAFVLPALQVAKRAQQLAEFQAQAARDAQQVAEAQAQAARDAQQVAEAQAQVARDAQQVAELQAQAEREARQLAEFKLQQVQAELARRQPP
jgi:hypothetical protein